jgi:predicted CXXCH cytochrome family protein
MEQRPGNMKTNQDCSRRLWCRLAIIAAVLLPVVAALVSCTELNKPLVVPPQIAGATFVGSQDCATCHEEITRFFPTATHARLMARGTNALSMGCEGCHGPGSLHSQSGGAAHTIINPGRSPQVCFQCHLDKRGEFSLPHHHPVMEGKVTCGNCHELHKFDAVAGGGISVLEQREVCRNCHTRQLGPFVFEHEGLREGCTACHSVHGSVNAKMLKERNQNLCLKCHFQRQVKAGTILIGDVDHTRFLSRGTCWSGGCHEAVHGSQVSQFMRF